MAMSSKRRRLVVVLLWCGVFGLHVLQTGAGNPTDSASVSARNANNSITAAANSSNATASSRNTSSIACEEDVLFQCPPNASCDKGWCVCMFRYKLNPAFHNGGSTTAAATATPTSTNGASSSSLPYCLLDESISDSASAGGGAGTPGKDHRPGSSAGNADQLPLREPAGAHHILSGVLIPLAFVVIMIGSALLAKRTQLWSRLRQRFQARRGRHHRRPAYEDVVLE
uniref:Secreted protein n=1 Tax=Anopheles triannulatus TaxID=58253 RepID=A0A2M4AYQ3_9DIPT